MAFTDDDLKELKNGMSSLRMVADISEYSLGSDELGALLNRLEAAEVLAMQCTHATFCTWGMNDICTCGLDKLQVSWYRASGQ